MKIEPVELEGVRARLVPLQEAHIPSLYETGRDEELWKFSALHATTLDEMSHLVHTFLQDQRRGQALPFSIIDLADHQIIGSTQLHSISQEHRHVEIGKTWLSAHTWGTHLNTECKYLLLRHCFETLEMLRVQFRTDGRNLRSQRAVERLGATREGVLRHNWVLPDGHIRDTVYYSILLEEWPACKHHLEGLLRSAFKDCL